MPVGVVVSTLYRIADPREHGLAFALELGVPGPGRARVSSGLCLDSTTASIS
jgi:hypothetical protein